MVLNSDTLSDESRLSTLRTIVDNTTDADEQLKYAKLLIENSEGQEDYSYKVNGYLRLGGANKQKGNLTEALQAYLTAAQISSNNQDYISEADAYTNVATIYTSNEDYAKSLQYYRDALELYTTKVDSQRLAIVYINYAYAAYKAQLYDSSLSLSEKAVYFSQFSSYKLIEAYAQSNMALALAKKGFFTLSEEKLEKSLEVMAANDDQYAIADCLIEIGGVYIEQNNLQTAIEKLTQGYTIALEHGLKQQIQNGAKFLAQAYKQQGDIEKAFSYQSKYYTYRDSLINAEQIRKLADLRTSYEVGQKQAEVDLLTAEKRTQQIIIFSTAGGALLVAILLGLVYKNYQDKNRINKVLEEQKQQLEELNKTKDKFFSIVSHDLRGPVSAFAGVSHLIKYAVKDNNHEELLEIAEHVTITVGHLSGLLDNLLRWAMQQQGRFPHVPEKLNLNELGEEIKGIFATTAEGKKIDLETDISDQIQLWADKNTTMTIFRNLVNNALKFTHQGGKVSIKARPVGEMAEIVISDTGVGMSPEKVKTLFKLQAKRSEFGTDGEKGLGLGLQLAYEFIEMNNGSISVKSQEGEGTEFVVRLPL
ncbi:ATP-binding protein, partial [Fulvivirga aurantia]|uniref:ATP-binding protein n=1 Tax=Fulvivirga aurantia TaxID=2529383 RepID=UPI001CA3E270